MPRLKRSEAEQRTADAAGPEFLEALARGLRVIEAFDRRQLSLSDAARAVDLPRASVRRTLSTLVHLGYAETDGRMFRLTPRILRLASSYLTSDPLPDIIRPAVERLSAASGEATSAAVLDGEDVVMIAHASPNRPLGVSAQIGLRLPAVSSSLGRALLSGLDDRALDKFLARVKPAKLTPATVIDKTKLRAAIARTRTDGYSLVDQEAEIGFRSIAVPLRRNDGRLVAALNIGVHCERGSPDAMLKTFLPKLIDAAAMLQRQLIA